MFCQPWGEHYDMYYFFSLKQNVEGIFIDGHRRKEQQKVIFWNPLKNLNFDKTFEGIIENELDFNAHGSAKI